MGGMGDGGRMPELAGWTGTGCCDAKVGGPVLMGGDTTLPFVPGFAAPSRLRFSPCGRVPGTNDSRRGGDAGA